MRVAYFLNDFPSLSQTFVLNQITGIIDSGADVEIFAYRKNTPDSVQEIIHKYKLLDKVKYIHGIQGGRKAGIVKIIKMLLSRNVFKYLVPVIKGLNVIKYGRASHSLQLPFDILQLSEPVPFDIIHCQFGTIANRTLNLIETGAIAGKLVTSFRGYDATRYALENPAVYSRLFKKGAHFFPVSESLSKTIQELGCPHKKITVVHSGIELDKFRYSKNKYPQNASIQVITVARLVEKKGVEFSIIAVAKAISQGIDIHYNIIGDGELLGNLQKIVARLGIVEKVTFHGWKTHVDVIKLLSSSHILMAPSITAQNGDQEGIPNVMKEAMAMGLPVIGTIHGGTPELVSHEKTGYLVEEKDSDSMAKYLIMLCTKPDIWADLSQSARLHIEKEFDSLILNKKLLSIYHSLISR